MAKVSGSLKTLIKKINYYDKLYANEPEKLIKIVDVLRSKNSQNYSIAIEKIAQRRSK